MRSINVSIGVSASGAGGKRISEREKLLISEIGEDVINTASSFVDYMADEYQISKSSLWYSLNCLKAKGYIDFADRIHLNQPLRLTTKGSVLLDSIVHERRRLIAMMVAAK